MDAARNLAARIPGFTPAFMRIFGAMLAFAKTTRKCWAKQENIARSAGCSDRHISRAIKFFLKCGLIHFEGYHYSGTCRYSFSLGNMSDKLSFAPVGSFVALVRRLVDDVASVVLPPTTSTPRSAGAQKWHACLRAQPARSLLCGKRSERLCHWARSLCGVLQPQQPKALNRRKAAYRESD